MDRCIPAAIHRRLWRLNYFWYNSLHLCLLYLFHATLIYSYILYVFDHLIHKSSDAPHFRGSILYGQTVPFILIILFLSWYLLYYLVFCFSPKHCRYCFSEVQLSMIQKWWLNVYILLFDLIKVVLFYIVVSPFWFPTCFPACFSWLYLLLFFFSLSLNSAPHHFVWCGALFFIVLTSLIFQGDIYCLFNASFIWLRCKGNKRELIQVSKNMI